MSVVLVTGARGFLGRRVVAHLRARGHEVRSMVRAEGAARDGEVSADLRVDDLGPALRDVDAVVHCAAAKSGDFHTQYASTVRGTERLLDACDAAGTVRTFVLCSSFAVYEHAHLRDGGRLDEDAPVDITARGRDAYAETKVLQEELVRERCRASGTGLVVMRPGVVYGDESWWTYRIGERFGRLWLALGSDGQVPLVSVDDCARALALAVGRASMLDEIYNVVEDDPPSRSEYRRALRAQAMPRPVLVPVPWVLARVGVDLLARLARQSATPWRLPGFLVPESLAVRAKPLSFPNGRLRMQGWRPQDTWSAVLHESSSDEPQKSQRGS